MSAKAATATIGHNQPPSGEYDRGYDDGFVDGVNDAAAGLIEAAKGYLAVRNAKARAALVAAIRNAEGRI